MSLDPRLTPARPDLAARHLQGKVDAPRFVDGVDYQVTAGLACIRKTPQADGRLETQALHGEIITIYDERGDFGWGQCALDSYVGWVDMEALSAPVLPCTHRVSALRTYCFSEPDLKSAPRFLLSLNAKLVVEGEEGRFLRCARAGFVFSGHAEPLGAAKSGADFVAIAERFLGAPYQWGGKESLGLDCSGLVQTALEAAGRPAPRDTDLQEREIGATVTPNEDFSNLQRGDLVFWRGHVGIMLDCERLLHANAHHMETAIEPLRAAIARIGQSAGPVSSVRRL